MLSAQNEVKEYQKKLSKDRKMKSTVSLISLLGIDGR